MQALVLSVMICCLTWWGAATPMRGDDSPPHEEKAGDATELALRLKKGTKLAYRVEASGPGSSKEVKTHSIAVGEVTASGEAALSISISNQKADSSSGTNGEAKARETYAVTLSSGGQLKSPSDKKTIPATLANQFRYIFASGLHSGKLETGKVYPLAGLYANGAASKDSATDQGIALRLTETDVKSGTCRFEVMARATETTQEDGSVTLEREWRVIGQAVYRTADGLLDTMQVKSVGESTQELRISRVASAD